MQLRKMRQPHNSPQDLQLKFPEHDELLQDLLMVNAQLVQYASELSKIVDG